MASQVLVAMDTSDVARQALRHTLETHPDADITVLTVVGEPSMMFGEATAIALSNDSEELAKEHAQPVLARAREIAAEYETEIETEAREHASEVLDQAKVVAAEYDTEVDTTVEMGHPAKAIVRRAEDFDTVVMGSHGGDFADTLFIGNVAKRVFRRSPVPVTTVR